MFLSGLWSWSQGVDTLARAGVKVGSQNYIEKLESESGNLADYLLRMEPKSVL